MGDTSHGRSNAPHSAALSERSALQCAGANSDSVLQFFCLLFLMDMLQEYAFRDSPGQSTGGFARRLRILAASFGLFLTYGARATADSTHPMRVCTGAGQSDGVPARGLSVTLLHTLLCVCEPPPGLFGVLLYGFHCRCPAYLLLLVLSRRALS
jgi:hypothetical protein